MATIEQLIEFRNRYNRFAVILGAKIIEMKEGYARCEMPVREDFYNPNHSVHGGVIFSLADITSGAAASSYGMRMTTMDATISFTAPAISSRVLYGEAKEVKRGKTVQVYDVWITDDLGKLIAKGMYTFYSLNEPIPLDGIGIPGYQENRPDRNPRITGSVITDHGSKGFQDRA
ncbi:MAG: PaaI family thioesterase [Lachnospiraceae bacterium]|nr:PaaI family thioesterase [Lachnospiraceae bacterium]